MLGMRNYAQKYIDGCRASVDADLAAYRKLLAAAEKQGTSPKAIDAFESRFFNNMVLVLDHFFVHRLRAVEGKDGNPLNEVRVLADSLMLNEGVMGTDKTIKMPPEKTILKIQVGDEIKLTQEDFAILSKAFFAEIESKYL